MKCFNQKTYGGWIENKTRPLHTLCTKDSLQFQRHTQTEIKVMKTDFSWKWKQTKQAGVAILITEKTDSKTTTIQWETKRDLAAPFLVIYLKKPQTWNKKGIYIHLLIEALLTIAKTWKQPKSLSMDEWIKKWGIYTMEYDSAIKKNEILPSATT